MYKEMLTGYTCDGAPVEALLQARDILEVIWSASVKQNIQQAELAV